MTRPERPRRDVHAGPVVELDHDTPPGGQCAATTYDGPRRRFRARPGAYTCGIPAHAAREQLATDQVSPRRKVA